MKLVLFDVDGTLLLTGGTGIRCMELAGQTLFGEHFSADMLDPAGSMDPDLYAQLIAHHDIPDGHLLHKDFQERYFHVLGEQLASPGSAWALPGVLDLLDLLRRRPDVDLGLVTGNYGPAVPIKLRAAGIDPGWFDFNAFGDEADDRAALVELARQRHADRRGRRLDGQDVILVGDTPNDVHAARQAGCQHLAVATGRFSAEQLRQVGAEHVAEDLTNPRPLLDLLA